MDGSETRSLYRLPDDSVWIDIAHGDWADGVLEVRGSWVSLNETYEIYHRYYLHSDQELVREEIGTNIVDSTVLTVPIVFRRVAQ